MAYIYEKAERKMVEAKPISIIPTVFVGVGGTGREILSRLRRRFIERYGGLDSLPVVQYVMVDTDFTESHFSDEAKDIVAAAGDFRDHEKVYASLGDTGSIFMSIDTFPHIKPWLDTRLMNVGKLEEKGAGAVRQFGRLAFFQVYPQITRALDDAASRAHAVGNAEVMRELGIPYEADDLHFVVVGSLAGGTGGGLFLDLGFLLGKRHPGATRVGIFLLARTFGTFEDHFANSYAALKELNYYSLDHALRARWTSQSRGEVFPPPPYEYCYLVDGVNEAGKSVGPNDRPKLLNAVADSLFCDFDNSEFGGRKRSARVNVLKDLITKAVFEHEHPEQKGKIFLIEEYPARFLSFGYASIFIPKDRIKHSCGYRLAKEVIDYWYGIRRPRPGALATEYLDKRLLPLLSLVQDNTRKHSDIFNAVYDNGEGGRLQDNVRRWAGTLYDNLMQGAPAAVGKSNALYVRDQLALMEANFGKLTEMSQDKGDYIRATERNAAAYIDKVKENMRSSLKTMVDEDYLGLPFTIECYEELRKTLTAREGDYIGQFQKDYAELGEAIDRAKRGLERAVEQVAQAEELPGLHFMLKKTALRFTFRRARYLAARYYNMLLSRECRRLAIEVCQEVANFIFTPADAERGIPSQGVLEELRRLRDIVQDLEKGIAEKETIYRRKPRAVLGYCVYEEEDIEKRYYYDVFGEGSESERKLSQFAEKLKRDLEVNLLTFLDKVEVHGVELVEEELLALCRREFDGATKVDVLENIYTLPAERLGSIIDETLEDCRSWIKPREAHTQVLPFSTDLKSLKIGLDFNSPKAEAFKKEVLNRKRPDDPQFMFYPIGDSSQVVFYHEVAGYPLSYIQGIDTDYREKYYHKLERGTVFHIEKDYYKYDDVVFMTDAERNRLFFANQAFYVGLVLGYYDVTAPDAEPEFTYVYYDRAGLRDTVYLGVKDAAIKKLSLEHGVGPDDKPRLASQIYDAAAAEIFNQGDSERNKILLGLMAWYVEDFLPSRLPEAAATSHFDPNVQRSSLEVEAVRKWIFKLRDEIPALREATPTPSELARLKETALAQTKEMSGGYRSIERLRT